MTEGLPSSDFAACLSYFGGMTLSYKLSSSTRFDASLESKDEKRQQSWGSAQYIRYGPWWKVSVGRSRMSSYTKSHYLTYGNKEKCQNTSIQLHVPLSQALCSRTSIILILSFLCFHERSSGTVIDGKNYLLSHNLILFKSFIVYSYR